MLNIPAGASHVDSDPSPFLWPLNPLLISTACSEEKTARLPRTQGNTSYWGLPS